jgi:hypothetical protein
VGMVVIVVVVVIERLGPGGFAASLGGDGGEGVAGEVVTHVVAGDLPHGEQHALSFMVTRAVLMRCAEIAEGDRAVDRRHNFRQPDLLRRSSEYVTPTDTALGAHEPGALQRQQNLLEVRLGECGALCDVSNRRRPGALAMQRKRQQCPTGIVPTSRYTHA